MKKIIKKLGGSYLITFDVQERKIYDINEGDYVDIELVKIKSPEDKK